MVTRISKKKLADETLRAMSDQFLMSIVHVRTKRDALALINELLSKTERIMLAKRFAIIAMLARGYSFSQIEDLLKVSPDTVVRIWRDAKEGRYAHVARYARNNPKKFEGGSFIDLLETLLRAGMPPRAGKGRWSVINRLARDSEYYD